MPLTPAILFDLDGTLVDTAPDLAASMNVLLVRRGRRQLELNHVRDMVGQGAKALMTKAMAATGTPATTAEIEEMYEEFLVYYGANIAETSRPFPGVMTALETLRDAGCAMGVCTNKPESMSRLLLNTLDMGSYFSTIVGGDTLAVRKPDPEHVLETMRRLGGDLSATVMVGDSQADIVSAQAANVPAIAVTFGYTPEPVATYNPDRQIDHFDELVGAIGDFVTLG